MPPLPRAAIGPAKWWQTCMGTMQFRCTIARETSTGLARNGSKFGSAPAQYMTIPTSSPAVASTILAMASCAARSTATARASAPVSARMAAATSSRTPWRRARSTTSSPRSAIARAYAAPTPSEAPATSAHGP